MKLLSFGVWSVIGLCPALAIGVLCGYWEDQHPSPPPSAVPTVPPGLPSAPPERTPPITDADIEAIRAGRRAHRARCDAARGVYLSFDDVCLKKGALVEEGTSP